MIEEFNKYVNNYDMNLYGISRKYNHSIRVMNLCRKYAKKLNYSDSDIDISPYKNSSNEIKNIMVSL